VKRPCLGTRDERCGIPTEGSRCPKHARAVHAPYNDPDYLRRRDEAIRAQPWCHNPEGCPYPDAGTPANPLTADHTIPLAAGGAHSRLEPWCKRCNSGKRDRLE
jgi:5-methylcytosine-specific restriction endonuclease McrA